MTIGQWIALASLLLPLLYFGLQQLSHNSFIAKSTAWSAIVAGAMNIVAQMERELKADPTMSLQQLISAGISELRSVYVDSFAKLGGTAVPDAVLTLLFQRVASRLPSSVDSMIAQLLTGPAPIGVAPSVTGAAAAIPLRRGARFIRTIGPVVAREAISGGRPLSWLARLVLVIRRLMRRPFQRQPFVFVYDGEVLG